MKKRLIALIILLISTGIHATTILTFKDVTEGFNGDLKFTTVEVSPTSLKTLVSTDDTTKTVTYTSTPHTLTISTSHPKVTHNVTLEHAALFKKQMTLAATDYDGFKKNLSLQDQALLSNIPKVSLPCMITKLSPERVYQLTNVGVSLNRWSCSHYKVFSKGILIEEIWITPFPQIKINQKDFNVFKTLPDDYLTLFQAQLSAVIPGIRIPFPEPSASGFPIKRIRYQDEKPIHTTQLLKVHTI